MIINLSFIKFCHVRKCFDFTCSTTCSNCYICFSCSYCYCCFYRSVSKSVVTKACFNVVTIFFFFFNTYINVPLDSRLFLPTFLWFILMVFLLFFFFFHLKDLLSFYTPFYCNTLLLFFLSKRFLIYLYSILFQKIYIPHFSRELNFVE